MGDSDQCWAGDFFEGRMADQVIHLLSQNDITMTCCGLEGSDLPREQVSMFPNKATCRECKQKDIERMLGNYATNTALERLRGGER
jgi:hypothetical protein